MSFNNMRRVRLSFDGSHQKCCDLSLTNCWMMVDFNSCKLVSDLENAITERFFAAAECGQLKLYVDDFVLPPQEVIHIIHENDIIRVEVSQSNQKADRKDTQQHNGVHCEDKQNLHPSEETCTRNKKQKRKKETKSDHSDMDVASSSKDVDKAVKHSSHKIGKESSRKRKKHGTAENTDEAVKHSSHEISKESSKKRKKHKTAENTGKDDISNNKEKPSSHSKTPKEKKRKKINSFHLDAEMKVTRAGAGSLPVKQKESKKTTDKMGVSGDNNTKKVVAKQSASISGMQESKSPKTSQVKEKKNKNDIAPNQRSSLDVRNSRLITKQDISKMIDDQLKKGGPAKSVGQRLLEISQTPADSLNSQPKLRPKVKNVTGHIHFGSSDESSSSDSDSSSESSPSEEEKEKTVGVKTLASKKQATIDCDQLDLKTKTVTTSPLESKGAGDVSDKQTNGHQSCGKTSDAIIATKNGFQNGVNGSEQDPWKENSNHEKKQENYSLFSKKGQLNTQLSNKSIVMQNPEGAETNGEPVDNIPEKPKDYTTCPPLVGPPRVGDKIAYKILELSNSYCPEVSDYKEAEVVSYSPESKTIEVKLKSALNKVKRYGRFELPDEGEEDGQICKSTNMVTLELSSLLEPRLL